MKNLLNGLAKFIAVFVAILFVISLVLTLFLYSLEKKAFDADTYKEVLENEDFYGRLPGVIGGQLVKTMGEEENQQSTFTKYLKAEDWEYLITALISPEELQKLSEETIDETFAFLNGDSDVATISLRGFKERLASERGADAFFTFLEAQDPCTEEDLLAFEYSANSKDMVFCNPPEGAMIFLEPFLRSQFRFASEKIPDENIFLRKTDLGSEFSEFQSLRILIRLSPIIPVALLFLLTLLVVRSLQSWLRWWGIPLLSAGGLGLIFSLVAGPILQSRISGALLERAAMGVPGITLQLSHDLLSTITSRLVGNIALSSLVIATFGLGLTLGGVFVKKSEEKQNRI